MENLETLENQEIELTKTELQECDSHEFACDNLTKAAMIAPEIQSIPAPIAAKNPEDWVTENFTWREFLHSQTAERLGLKNEPTASEKQNIQAVAQWLEKLRALFRFALLQASALKQSIAWFTVRQLPRIVLAMLPIFKQLACQLNSWLMIFLNSCKVVSCQN